MLNGVFNDLNVGQRFIKLSDLNGSDAPPIYEKTTAKHARLAEDTICTACNALCFDPDEPVVESLSLAPSESMLGSAMVITENF